MEDESVQHTNIAEEEMGQLHSIHFSLNAIAALRRNMPTGPSLKDCEDCGEAIPLQRLEVVQGCRKCVLCQRAAEATKL
jgi:phage/conjugal plasmid C-4 type zinc finger TraR family protein